MKKIITTFIAGVCSFWAVATTYNIAPQARITASAETEAEPASNVTDGIVRVKGKGSWNCGNGVVFWGEITFPWIQLDWDNSVEINRVVLYNRPDNGSYVAGGVLRFSDGEEIRVLEIPADGSPKVVEFPACATESLRFEVADGDGAEMGLSEIEVYGTPTDFVSAVDPYIETTRGRYFFSVTGSQPYGMMSAMPLTRNKNQWGGGYNYNDSEILGFPQIHGWMLSGLNMMPVTGNVDASQGEKSWKSHFSHAGEIVQPAYHRLYLDRYGIWVEQTNTDRASIYRLTLTDEADAGLLLHLGGYISTATMVGAHVEQTDSTRLDGYFDTTGRLWGGPDKVRIFWTAEFDRPVTSLTEFGAMKQTGDSTYFADTEATPRNEGMTYYDAPVAGIRADFGTLPAGTQIHVKMAFSYTTPENARLNLSEIPAFDFDSTRKASQAEWNDMLGRIDVKGGDPADRIKLYTDLWHALLGRHKLDDLSGDYPDYTKGGNRNWSFTENARLTVRALPKDKSGKVRFHMYNSDGVWLTMWNLNSLWGLAYPEVIDDFSASFLQYSFNGDLLPRGPCAGGYSFIMSGCPATSMITSAYQRGLDHKFDARKALREMVRNHERGGMLAYGQYDDLDFYEAHGYVPNAGGLTIQWAFEDWALAEMASKMGQRKIADRFYRRSRGWEASFNPDLKMVLPRTREGGWLHTDPLSGWGFVESNAWQATFGLSHALPRLAEMMGGDDALCERLDYGFRMSAPENFMGVYGHGHVAYSNQPGLSSAHVFAHAGRPDLTQYWVRRVRRQAYGGTTPDLGYGGQDEDQGQMGALSALMSIGLFSIDGGSSSSPAYDITSPIFDEITLRLNPEYCQGKEFKIIVHDNAPDNYYIKRAVLNGEELKALQVSHADYARGGVLELWLAPTAR